MSNDTLKQEFLSKHNYKDSRNVKIKDTIDLYKENKMKKYSANARFKSYTESLSFTGKAIFTTINFVHNLNDEAYRSFDARIDAYSKELDREDLSESRRDEILKIQDDIHREKIEYIEHTRKDIIKFVSDISKAALTVGSAALIVTKISDKYLDDDVLDGEDTNEYE